MLIFFRLGLILEVSFELLDTLDMIQSKGVWKQSPGSPDIHPGAYLSTIAHHVPGLCLAFPLNLWCSCVGLWQIIAISLELGGFASILLVCIRDSMIVDENVMTLATRLKIALVDLASLVLLLWVRFTVVTPAMYEICKAGLEDQCKTTYAVIVGAVLLTVFNVLWLVDISLKLVDSIHQVIVQAFKEVRVFSKQKSP
jgi:hypothetical protein